MDNLIKSESAASGPIGFVLIFSIILISIGMVYVGGEPVLENTQENTHFIQMEQSFVLFSDNVNKVGFERAPIRNTELKIKGGTLSISHNSWIAINGTRFDLGSIEYEFGDKTLAYENGGVWTKYSDGTGAGTGSIYLKSNALPLIIYPNISWSDDLRNPLFGKQIKIRLQSEYYKPWAEYIKERTGVATLTNDLTQEVIVSLNSKPHDTPGPLVIPIEVMGLDTTNSTPLRQFMFILSGVDSSLHAVFRAPDQTSDDFAIELQKRGGMGTSGVDVMIWYNKGGFNETWKSETEALIIGSNASINLLNSSAQTFYKTNSPSGTWLNETPPYNRTFVQSGDAGPVPLNIILQHYIKLISDTGTFALYPGTLSGDPAWGKGFDPSASENVMDYEVMPPRITYLHIVEHDVDVGLE